MDAARTTIIMRPSLLARLKLFAHRHNRTMSQVVEEGVSQVIDRAEQNNLDTLYKGLLSLSGIIDDPTLTDASSTIDEVLYGETRQQVKKTQVDKGRRDH